MVFVLIPNVIKPASECALINSQMFNHGTSMRFRIFFAKLHCLHFPQVIPPSGNTTFDVVFLGRQEGHVENTLYIHTSAGSFRFRVKATGTANSYRLRPLVGVRMPLNSSYSPLIEIHNPHPEPIQVGRSFI